MCEGNYNIRCNPKWLSWVTSLKVTMLAKGTTAEILRVGKAFYGCSRFGIRRRGPGRRAMPQWVSCYLWGRTGKLTTTNAIGVCFFLRPCHLYFPIFRLVAFHQGVSFRFLLCPPGSPIFGISSWVALPIKGERSELTRLLFPPLVFVPAPFSKASQASDI